MSFHEYILASSSQPIFVVRGSYGSDGTVEVTTVRGQNGTECLLGVPSDAELILIDASHRELACGRLCRDLGYAVPVPPPGWKPSDSLGCSPFVTADFSAEVPARPGGVALVIRRGSEVLWTRAIDRSRPTVQLLSCERAGDVGRVTWTSDSAENPHPQLRIEFSIPDRLEHWRLVAYFMDAADLSEADFDLVRLPPGRVLIRLVLDDGFYTTPSNSLELDVPAHPLEIEISAPVAAVVPEGLGKLSVTAVAREWRGQGSFENGEIHDRDAYHWMLDDTSLGRGKTILIDPPPLGLHTLTVTVKSNDKEARASIAFEMTDQLLEAIESERPQISAMREYLAHVFRS